MSDIQTEKTYDSVFWTGVVRLTPYLIPLVNEVFGTHYSSQTQIRLLPFFGFLYVNTEEELNTETILKRFREDFDRICREFDDESGKKLLEKDEAYYLLELIQRVLDKLFSDNNEITEEVDKTMGGKLIEFELDRKIKESHEEGREEGRAEGRVEGREEGTVLTVDAVKAIRNGGTEAELRKAGFDECSIKAAREIVAMYS